MEIYPSVGEPVDVKARARNADGERETWVEGWESSLYRSLARACLNATKISFRAYRELSAA